MDEVDDDDDDDDDNDEEEPTKPSTSVGMDLPDEVKEPTHDSETLGNNPTMEWTYEENPIKMEVEEPADGSGTHTNQGNLTCEEVKQEPTTPPQSQQHPSTSQSYFPSYVDVTNNEIHIIRNKNTVKKVESSSRQFQRWLAEPPRCDEREIFHIMPPELDDYIGTFLLSIRKADGSDYEPDSLTSYHRGISRYLKENQYPYSIVKDMEFETSRQLLASKRKELKRKGKGKRPNAVGPMKIEDTSKLREKDVAGLDTPTKLLHLMWLNNTVLFGLKGGIENRRLRWGDLTLKIDDEGREYLEYNERLTKLRTGVNSDFRVYNPKQFAHASLDTCPVHAFKVYGVHRPVDMCEPESPFYLAINYKRLPGSERWYKSQPLGQNTLNSIMKKMAAARAQN